MLVEYVCFAERCEDNTFGVFFPDFLGCCSAGDTLEEARKNAREVLLDYIESMMEDNLPIPKASSLNEVMQMEQAKDCIPLILPIIMPSGKAQRVNITIDGNLLSTLDLLAEKQRKTRSAFIAEAVEHLITTLN